MSNSKKIRPISRRFWSLLDYLPNSLRAKLIRSQFEVDYELPKELIFKQAETADEIEQALRIVYNSYIDLNYIDANEARLRVTKHHAIPTTVILIAKWDNEVVGTISIIPDSAMGIPSDMTWNLDKYRANGQQIAEVSSLAIKKNYRRKRGKLLFPLCKIMATYCIQFFKIDGIIASTTMEVESFYTDVLLFEKVVEETGQSNELVKGNPSTCCYLPLDQNSIDHYKKVYSGKNKKSDLYNFLYVEKISNIQLPDYKQCLQAYTSKQNVSLAEVFKNYPFLTTEFTEKDKIILKNIDIADAFLLDLEDAGTTYAREHKRYHIKQPAWLFSIKKKNSIAVYITDVSDRGIKIVFTESTSELRKNDEVLIFFDHENTIVQLTVNILWIKNNRVAGCTVVAQSAEWHRFSEKIFQELSTKENVIPLKVKKTA